MTIKNVRSNIHSPKRRKLSHDTNGEDIFDDPEDVISGNQAPVASNKIQQDVPGSRSQAAAQKPRKNVAKATVLPTGGINKSSVLALQLTDLNAEITPNYERLRRDDLNWSYWLSPPQARDLRCARRCAPRPDGFPWRSKCPASEALRYSET